MNVFIIGGTGLIGYYSTLEFLKRGHKVSTLSLPDINLGSWFPGEVKVNFGNVFEMSSETLSEMFTEFDILVYAVGPDDRFTPKAPAYDFFCERLVTACGRVVSAAKSAGIRKCIVLNSYLAYFNRKNPELKLSEHHQYIKCRIEQAETVIHIGGDGMDVMVLELPYVFGTMPERTPLWKDILVSMLQKNKVILYPKGGSSMISVEHVAEAIAGAAECGRHGIRYPIGDVNLTWDQMLQIMLDSMDMGNKKIITIPCFLASFYGKFHKRNQKKLGLESGLDYSRLFKDVMCRTFYFDPSQSAEELGYGRGGIEASIDKTIKACLQR